MTRFPPESRSVVGIAAFGGEGGLRSEIDECRRSGRWVSKELKASMWWAHLWTRPGERRWGAVGENDFLRHYHQSPARSGPPILPWGWTRRAGGWGTWGNKSRFFFLAEQTINNLFLSFSDCFMSASFFAYICPIRSLSVSIFHDFIKRLHGRSGMAPAGQSPLLGSIASLIIPQAVGSEQI